MNLNITENNTLSRILKGFGQIMLQENSATGFLIVLGVFYGSILMGAAAFLAAVCGTGSAILLQYDKQEIDKGLYGFNAALVGAAVPLFFKPILICWIFIIVGSVLTTLLQRFFRRLDFPAFTLPFVLVTWIILVAVNQYFPEFLVEKQTGVNSPTDYFAFAIKGFGQVIFQDNLISGLLFFLAVLISSPISALYGLGGSVLSGILAYQLSAPTQDIAIGLYSYNSVLCAIVFATNHRKDSIWVFISLISSVFLSFLMYRFNLTQLTFPFVLVSSIILFIKGRIK